MPCAHLWLSLQLLRPAPALLPTPPDAIRFPAGACAKHSPVPVTFFARKGADCLGKFHGEAERTLRLLFEEVSAEMETRGRKFVEGNLWKETRGS